MCLFSVFGVVCCVLFYNPCACTLFVFGSGWSTVARLKLEGIDGKAPPGAEPAACEPAACERPVVVCVGREGGGGGTGVCIDRVSVCTFKTSACVPAPSPHFSIHVGLVPVRRYTRGRFERTHGCFHMFFHRAAPHHTTHTNHTPRPPTTPRPHNTTRRQKQRETEKDRQEKRRRDKKAREEKRRDEKEERRRRREKMKEKR